MSWYLGYRLIVVGATKLANHDPGAGLLWYNSVNCIVFRKCREY